MNKEGGQWITLFIKQCFYPKQYASKNNQKLPGNNLHVIFFDSYLFGAGTDPANLA